MSIYQCVALVVLLVLCLSSTISGHSRIRHLPKPKHDPRVIQKALLRGDFQELFYEQTLDHFNFAEPRTFSQRYLMSSNDWAGVDPQTGSCKGPIFFYTGNEGDIVLFWENTGFVHYLAKRFGALVIFAEHRYYGKSLPFGDKSFDLDKVGYLTSEQALADFAQMIPDLKTSLNAGRCPVIAFGGSYGGMLTAWMRLKYANIIDGGIASSAPIFQFAGTETSEWIFNQIITQDFAQAAPNCEEYYRQSFASIMELSTTPSGLAHLSSLFRLCSPMKSQDDFYTFLGWLENGVAFEAMADYPYPADFLGPMPAFPVNVSCSRIVKDDGRPLLNRFFDAMSVFYNYTGQVECFNILEQIPSSLGEQGWDYQACTEMVFPVSSNGTSDFYPPAYFSLEELTAYCQKKWKVTPRPYWIPTYYGATVEDLRKSGLSNVVFTNGVLDPWTGGGVQRSVSQSAPAILIPQAAHHLDLRYPDPEDPASVVIARNVEIQSIHKWIEEANVKYGNY